MKKLVGACAALLLPIAHAEGPCFNKNELKSLQETADKLVSTSAIYMWYVGEKSYVEQQKNVQDASKKHTSDPNRPFLLPNP